jgi:SNF2 family DNA or RNA helicase
MNKLWLHQIEAAKFSMARLRSGGTLLAMEMGTGKLLSSLIVANELKSKLILVVATKRAVDEWTLQLEQWWTWGKITVLSQPNKTVAKEVEFFKKSVVEAWKAGHTVFVLTNYQRVWRPPFLSFAKNIRWDLVVADEVHKIKAPGGKASKALHVISSSAKYRLGLSGTPMPHEHTDIYATARFIDSSVYGTRNKDFVDKFAVMGGFEGRKVVGIKNPQEFADRFWSFTYRVDGSTQDLPKTRNLTIPVVLNTKTYNVYKKLKNDYTVKIRKDKENHEISVDNTLTCMLRLMQVTSGFLPNEDGKILQLGNDKEEALEDVLDNIDSSETVIVFANFHPDLDAIERVAKRLKRPYGEISGRRSDYLDWRRGEKKIGVMGVQLQAGAESINLTAANTGVFYSLPLSLDLFKQARKRIHRFGQTRKVLFVFLTAKGTWDIKTKRALIRRENVVQSVLKDITQGDLL